MEQNKIIIYQTEDGQTQIDVRLENETVWLTQAQMAELFEKTPQNITMHIGNAYKEGESVKSIRIMEVKKITYEEALARFKHSLEVKRAAEKRAEEYWKSMGLNSYVGHES